MDSAVIGTRSGKERLKSAFLQHTSGRCILQETDAVHFGHADLPCSMCFFCAAKWMILWPFQYVGIDHEIFSAAPGSRLMSARLTV